MMNITNRFFVYFLLVYSMMTCTMMSMYNPRIRNYQLKDYPIFKNSALTKVAFDTLKNMDKHDNTIKPLWNFDEAKENNDLQNYKRYQQLHGAKLNNAPEAQILSLDVNNSDPVIPEKITDSSFPSFTLSGNKFSDGDYFNDTSDDEFFDVKELKDIWADPNVFFNQLQQDAQRELDVLKYYFDTPHSSYSKQFLQNQIIDTKDYVNNLLKQHDQMATLCKYIDILQKQKNVGVLNYDNCHINKKDLSSEIGNKINEIDNNIQNKYNDRKSYELLYKDQLAVNQLIIKKYNIVYNALNTETQYKKENFKKIPESSENNKNHDRWMHFFKNRSNPNINNEKQNTEEYPDNNAQFYAPYLQEN